MLLSRVRDIPILATVPPWATASTLRFTDPISTWRLRVDAMDGNPVAFVKRAPFRQRFTATGTDGSPLWQGHRQAISKYFDLWDASAESLGAFLVTTTREATVTLADGGEFHIRQRWFGSGWAMFDDAGDIVLWAVRTAKAGLSMDELDSGRDTTIRTRSADTASPASSCPATTGW